MEKRGSGLVVLEVITCTWVPSCLSQPLSLCCLCNPHLSQGQLLSAGTQLISGVGSACRLLWPRPGAVGRVPGL